MSTWLRRLLFISAAVLILIGFGVWAYTALHPVAPAWLQRAAILVGGLGALVSIITGLIQAWGVLRERSAVPRRPPDFPFAIVRQPDKVLTTLFGESPNPPGRRQTGLPANYHDVKSFYPAGRYHRECYDFLDRLSDAEETLIYVSVLALDEVIFTLIQLKVG